MKECKAIRIGGYGFNCQNHMCYNTCKSINSSMSNKDYFFRDTDICPDEYIWKEGEYNGWLQFKWGDGKNAINYVKPQKQKIKKVQNIVKEDEELNVGDYEVELIETKFADIIDKETQKRFMEKYGW